MTKDVVKCVPYGDLERAYSAYSTLALIYENTFGGPYKAREHKEYFAIMDSRNNIRLEVERRAQEDGHGEQ